MEVELDGGGAASFLFPLRRWESPNPSILWRTNFIIFEIRGISISSQLTRLKVRCSQPYLHPLGRPVLQLARTDDAEVGREGRLPTHLC